MFIDHNANIGFLKPELSILFESGPIMIHVRLRTVQALNKQRDKKQLY